MCDRTGSVLPAGVTSKNVRKNASDETEVCFTFVEGVATPVDVSSFILNFTLTYCDYRMNRLAIQQTQAIFRHALEP